MRTFDSAPESSVVQQVNWVLVEASRAAARRQRSEYVHCQIKRAWLWLLDVLPRHAAPRIEPCC